MRQKGFAPIVILLVIVVVALVGVAYLAGAKGFLVNNTPLVSSTFPSPSASPTITQTKYTNTKYSYEISYPNGWKIIGLEPGVGDSTATPVSRGIQISEFGGKYNAPNSSVSVEVDPSDNLSRGKWEDWISQVKKNAFYKVDKELMLSFNNIDALVLESNFTNQPNPVFYKGYYFRSPDDKNYFTILIQSDQNPISANLEQIATSFKITK